MGTRCRARRALVASPYDCGIRSTPLTASFELLGNRWTAPLTRTIGTR
ncbi:hypothetical protein Q5424_21115 [Conexibacter sp. JD483]|nr:MULTISPECIES: hypothetical protein [unclassified Conexibacter]MDO8188910.1 hypothetical protein [Conexibacter sp. CPCC 205706]MDO8200265.1 hypothetical protein [Conexibacter sp. CPCC 205762]MDR9371614.1 hypothetical protein [Conexibacter sp. JD483]